MLLFSGCLCRIAISVSQTGNYKEKSENLPKLESVSSPVFDKIPEYELIVD